MAAPKCPAANPIGNDRGDWSPALETGRRGRERRARLCFALLASSRSLARLHLSLAETRLSSTPSHSPGDSLLAGPSPLVARQTARSTVGERVLLGSPTLVARFAGTPRSSHGRTHLARLGPSPRPHLGLLCALVPRPTRARSKPRAELTLNALPSHRRRVGHLVGFLLPQVLLGLCRRVAGSRGPRVRPSWLRAAPLPSPAPRALTPSLNKPLAALARARSSLWSSLSTSPCCRSSTSCVPFLWSRDPELTTPVPPTQVNALVTFALEWPFPPVERLKLHRSLLLRVFLYTWCTFAACQFPILALPLTQLPVGAALLTRARGWGPQPSSTRRPSPPCSTSSRCLRTRPLSRASLLPAAFPPLPVAAAADSLAAATSLAAKARPWAATPRRPPQLRARCSDARRRHRPACKEVASTARAGSPPPSSL